MPFEITNSDILKVRVDTIVNPISSNPCTSDMMTSEIYQNAGPSLFEERVSFGFIKRYQAIITYGYNLPSPYVIHIAVLTNSDETGTALNYDVISETIHEFRMHKQINPDWNKKINDDYKNRKK